VSKRTARGLAAAITFLSAAVGGVIGNRVTDKVTPALIVFAIVLVVGAIPSYLVGRGDDAPAPAPPAPAQPTKARAEGAGSVAVGRDNTGTITTNVYGEPKPSNPQE
jgi:hypothetical protein